MFVFELKNVQKVVSDKLTLQIDELNVYRGERIGIVGLNGAGKTTLLKMMLGEIPVDRGEIVRRGRAGWITQTGPVERAVQNGFEHDADPIEQKEMQRQLSIWKLKHVAKNTMSGGEETRLKIAHALSAQLDILAADEPTTHLDMDAAKKLSDELSAFPGTLLLISHDRDLLDRLCEKIIEVENGRIKTYTGNYSDYREAKQLEREQAEAEYEQYVKEKKRLEQAVYELRSKSQKMTGAPKRMGNSEARIHKGGIKQRRAKVERNFKVLEARLNRLETKEKPREREPIRFDQGGFPELRGKWAIRLDRLALTVGSRRLFHSLTCMVRPGMKVALIGPNGSGKTSLLNAIYSEYEKEAEDKGSDFLMPKSCRIGYFHQKLEQLDESKSLLDNIRSVSHYPDTLIRTVLARLHFKREEVLKPAAVLSGGEKVKAGLAMVFLSDSNVLLLDEPTNYLDVFTQEELEEMLASYPGTILFSSHNRRFIAAVADHVLELGQDVPRFYPLEKTDGDREEPNDPDEAKQKDPLGQRYEAGSDVNRQDRNRSAHVREQLMILELELSEVLGRLSVLQPGEEKEKLDQRYNEILSRMKEWRK